MRILDRPAAVSFLKSLDITHATVLHEREGRPEIKQVRRPASNSKRLYSRGFRVGHLHIYIYCTVKNTGDKNGVCGSIV